MDDLFFLDCEIKNSSNPKIITNPKIDKVYINLFLILKLSLFLVIFPKNRNFLFDEELYFSEFFSK